MNKRLYIALILISSFLLSGCAYTHPEYSIGMGKNAHIETDLIGLFEGKGIVKSTNGAITTTFTAKMEGYKEGSVIFLRETYVYENAGEKTFTYRITPDSDFYRFDCIRIETLDSCDIKRASGTISIETNRTYIKDANIINVNSINLFHFLDDKRLLKQTYFNKLLFMEDMTELVHYTRIY
ncbi:MAG: hypothetical protein C0603_11420 [Denitrovibrio sp.]|nr:MAG: hypothetical protein C0603_11420 [Denitrovibrio sp.]